MNITDVRHFLYVRCCFGTVTFSIKPFLFGPGEHSDFPRILLECNCPVKNQLGKDNRQILAKKKKTNSMFFYIGLSNGKRKFQKYFNCIE